MKYLEKRVLRFAGEALLSLGCGAAFYLFAKYDAARLYSLANTLATVSGVLFGFLLTAIAMMVSLPDRKLVANMRLTGHYGVLVRGALQTCGFHFLALSVSLLSIFLEGRALAIVVGIALVCEVFAILRTFQSGRRFWVILEALDAAK